MSRIKILLFFILCIIKVYPQINDSIFSDRPDGRFISTYGYLITELENTKPALSYDSTMSKLQFYRWQDDVKAAMENIMKFPMNNNNQPDPVCISTERKDGYVLEKWEFYPFPKCVSTFLVLKPDNVIDKAPAVLCIPGSGRTKEGLAGEPGIYDCYTEEISSDHVTMALDYAKAGYIAVAVDNAGAGEASDIEHYSNSGNYNYDVISRLLLEMGWSWLGYTSYLDMQVLKWMKSTDYIDKNHIILSGFSLGTEPMMVLGVMDKDIYAFVYNDFLCNTQERAVVMTKPNKYGNRPFPNSIRHLIPDYWRFFNFPDVVASLAPRPIIFTEGALDRDFELVKNAYEKVNAVNNVKCYHYPKFSKKEDRLQIEKLPKGLDSKTYFRMVNVDPPSHYFKSELVIPWIDSILK